MTKRQSKLEGWKKTGICPQCGERKVHGGYCDCGWQSQEYQDRKHEKELREERYALGVQKAIVKDDQRLIRKDGESSVAKNSWWYAICPKHKEQPHLSYLGGRCMKCVEEALDPDTLCKQEHAKRVAEALERGEIPPPIPKGM